MKLHAVLVWAVLGLTLAVARAGSDKVLLNVDKEGVGIQGYDPVGFFTDHKPVKGSPAFSSAYHGVAYHFASAEHKAAFDAEPAKYEPQFGGYCAYGVSRDNASPIKVEAFQIVDGRLLMQYSLKVRDLFNEDTQGNLKLADQKWPSLVEKKGTPASSR
jgi:YHS domain-containing protein